MTDEPQQQDGPDIPETEIPNTQETTPSKEEKTWGMIGHLTGFAGLIGIPFGNILGPLIVWLIKKDESDYIAEHAREALNFQIAFTIYGLICGTLIIVLIGIPLILILAITWLILVIKASIAANKGLDYRYPYIFRLIN